MLYFSSKFKIQLLLIFFIVFSLSSCNNIQYHKIDKGVSINLAQQRKQTISDIEYYLNFNIPDSINQLITGKERIFFSLENKNKPVVIDFREDRNKILSIKSNNKKAKVNFYNGHIIIPTHKLKEGKNIVEISFVVGETSLNRNDEYLYSLFVPDRASTAFPCFDQPDMKAKFNLSLTIPKEWIAISNANLKDKIETDNNKTYNFEKTELLSTYLFSFVVGKFNKVTKEQNGIEISMYHREKDTIKLQKNIQEIFNLQFKSIKWLEKYLNYQYPFSKFEFILIPSFQYSGMEHPGAILYRDSKLLLDKNATIRDKLSRINLIAHETSHVWFGDLVTMQWFNEVWLKEVFANFMADKISKELIPEVNHELNFLISHYPPSYSVDRTKGANPIQQKLDNLINAGTLYGAIIYHKAPIIMKHLQMSVGEDVLQESLQKYLKKYAFNNASWNDLLKIINSKSKIDLQKWNNSWVNTSGMPEIKIHKAYDTNNDFSSVILEQKVPDKKGKLWEQNLEILLLNKTNKKKYIVHVKDTFNSINFSKPIKETSNLILNSNGMGYGYFVINENSKKYLLWNTYSIINPVTRCSVYINLWENMLNNNIEPEILFNSFILSLKKEKNPQNINLLLEYIETGFWKFLNNLQRNKYSKDVETFLWKNIKKSNIESLNAAYFKTYQKIAYSDESIAKLKKIWEKKISINGITLSKDDYTKLAYEIAIRMPEKASVILNSQLKRIDDIEKQNRLRFVMPVFSNDIKIRDAFF
ncbi:MAG: M1 family aminopeptidase, partial [Bacteroidales bacterium]|nr:M1 family aminopeptidase [Bacteroidales bacterium]